MVRWNHVTLGGMHRRPVRRVSGAVYGRFSAQQRHRSRHLPAFSKKFRQPSQVDGGHRQCEYQLGTLEATQLQLAQRAVLLAVAEDSFDQFANDLTHCIAGMACGALIDRTGAPLGALSNMRGNADSVSVRPMPY